MGAEGSAELGEGGGGEQLHDLCRGMLGQGILLRVQEIAGNQEIADHQDDCRDQRIQHEIISLIPHGPSRRSARAALRAGMPGAGHHSGAPACSASWRRGRAAGRSGLPMPDFPAMGMMWPVVLVKNMQASAMMFRGTSGPRMSSRKKV